MWNPRAVIAAVGLLAVCALAEGARPPQAPSPPAVVYVCACLGKRSCPCMTEAMQKGPCACGTKGGPPLKAVLANSAWARHNRQVLSGSNDSN